MRYQCYVRAVFIVTALLLFHLTTGVTQAQEATIHIAKKVTLAPDGSAANITLRVSCPAGMQVLEAFVYIVQKGNQSRFGSFSPTCDGEAHSVVAHVSASPDALFKKGKAHASAYMLLLDPATQNTLSGQDYRRVHLKSRQCGVGVDKRQTNHTISEHTTAVSSACCLDSVRRPG